MSNEPKANMNLDPEMLAAYIDNRLTPQQRAVVEAQLASDPDSYAVLVETLKALDQISVPEVAQVREAPGTRRWAVAVGVLAAAAALVLIVAQPGWLQRLNSDRTDAQLQSLVAAAGDERYLEGRLTGGFHYGSLRSTARGTGTSSQQNFSLLAASAEAQNSAADSAKGLRVTGIAKLLVGDTDGGIAALEESVRRDATAAALADLSAAYLLRASATLAEGDLRFALESANRALALKPQHPEALYNRALAAEKLGMPQAIGYWEATIANTATAEWRDDAQRRLSALRARQQ